MFKEYIIDLCRRHHDIHHRDDEIHFIDLSTDRRNTALAQQMRYPGVFLDRTGYTYRTTGNGLRRYANMTLDIWQHVTDTADYDQIERVIEKCDSILNDFVMMMMVDMAKADIDIDSLRQSLTKISEEMGVEINIMAEKVFSAMHRV